MERWQKIERCLSEFFRNQLCHVYQQGDVFAKYGGGDEEGDESSHVLDVEFNLTQLAKEIDSELGYDKNKDLSGCFNEGYAAIRERVANGGPVWDRKK